MAALLVGLSVMAVVMTMAMPVWSTAAKRAREDELVFRGEQYARAIGLYQRKYANALPPSIDVLLNERFLRRKYLDPITGGEFQALTGAAGQATPGVWRGRAGSGAAGDCRRSAGRGAARSWRGAARQRLPDVDCQPLVRSQARQGGALGGVPGGAAFGASGGIVGVASKSTEKSLRLYNGRGAYNEWTFVAVQRQTQAGAGAAGAQAPGPGRGGRAGDRGTGPALRIRHEPPRDRLVPAARRAMAAASGPPPAGSHVSRSGQTLPNASITASWNAGRTCVMPSPARDGCTRLVSSTT